MFDVGNRASFEALDAWVEEAHKHGARDMQVVVCGNKCERYKWGWAPQRFLSVPPPIEAHGRTSEMLTRCAWGPGACSKNREVKPKEAQAWASKNGYMYYETSAHSGDNVQTSFSALFSTVVRNLPQR